MPLSWISPILKRDEPIFIILRSSCLRFFSSFSFFLFLSCLLFSGSQIIRKLFGLQARNRYWSSKIVVQNREMNLSLILFLREECTPKTTEDEIKKYGRVCRMVSAYLSRENRAPTSRFFHFDLDSRMNTSAILMLLKINF